MAFLPSAEDMGGGGSSYTPPVGKKSDALAGQVNSGESLEEMLASIGVDFKYKKPGQTASKKQVLMYPQGLGERPEYMNYIGFEIFETGGSGLDSNKESFFSSLGGSNEALITGLGALTPQVVSKLQGIGTAVGNTWNVKAAVEAAADISQTGPLGAGVAMLTSGMGTGIVSNLANSAGIGKLSNDAGIGWTQEKTGLGIANKKIDKTIYLYLPGSVNVAYNQSYNESDDMAGMQAFSDITKTTGNSIKSLLDGTSNADYNLLGKELADKMGRGLSPKVSEPLSKATESLGLEKVNAKQYYEALTRQVPNPMILSLFQNTNRRTFKLGYEFYPTSEREMEEVYVIVETFKKYSHPKRSTDAGRMLDYPAEFKLTFYYGNNENRYLPRLSRCALTSVDLNYGEKPFNTFRPNSKGAPPTKIKMELNFTELNILTQTEIEKGY